MLVYHISLQLCCCWRSKLLLSAHRHLRWPKTRKKDEEKFDFTAEGEALGYVSLDQAQVLAMLTAREMPGAYGATYVDVPMAWVADADEVIAAIKAR